MSLSTFLAPKIPVLNFLNFLNSRVLFSYKPLSYKKIVYAIYKPRLVVLWKNETLGGGGFVRYEKCVLYARKVNVSLLPSPEFELCKIPNLPSSLSFPSLPFPSHPLSPLLSPLQFLED